MNTIQKIDTTLATRDQREEPSIGAMIQAVVEKGVTNENVAAVEKLVALYERMQDRNAEKAFAVAFMELQKELPRVKATKIIPNKDGSMRSSFAPFEEIDAQLRPLAFAHGFTYSFAEGPFDQGRITKVCTVQHTGGHKRSNPFSVRIGHGPPGCSEAQADGAAHSYAKRGALCDAFSVVVSGIDNDARVVGNEDAKITPQQAEELEHRVAMTNSNRQAFLDYCEAKTFADIPANKYADADIMLKRKERGGK